MYLTILIPCLNESKTIGECIDDAFYFLHSHNIDGEVLVCDNGSEDDSCDIVIQHGARLVYCSAKGYGNALRCGIADAKGEYIIFGDGDCSYDFRNLDGFVAAFQAGHEFVNGNRFKGGIEKGAMPFSHKLGVPVLSWLAKMKYKVPVYDFHCGLRGFKKSIFDTCMFTSTGMEFATEIIAKANKYNMTEIPVKLRCDKRDGSPHLRTIRDGFRHFIYILKN